MRPDGEVTRMAYRLKSQDVLLALRLTARPEPTAQAAIAEAIGISTSEVSKGLKRLNRSHLYNLQDRRVVRSSLREFLCFGLRYVFPARLGLLGEGMPTAHSASPLSERIQASESDGAVWEAPVIPGVLRMCGRVVEPIHKSAPQAASKDPALYELLALVDAVRVGRARERKFARDELAGRLGAPR